MFVRFIGGSVDGKEMNLPDDQEEIHFAQINGAQSRDRYVKRRWQGVDKAHGYDAVFVHDQIPEDGLAEAIGQAFAQL